MFYDAIILEQLKKMNVFLEKLVNINENTIENIEVDKPEESTIKPKTKKGT
jgi:hypothetical protein